MMNIFFEVVDISHQMRAGSKMQLLSEILYPDLSLTLLLCMFFFFYHQRKGDCGYDIAL